MKGRYSQLQSFALRTYPVGEIHLGVELLTPKRGLLSAIAYGARSQTGKLHGKIEQFSYARCMLYAKDETQMHKIAEYEDTRYFAYLREDLSMYCYASLWCEFILRSFRGEEHAAEVFTLLGESLKLLQCCSATQTRVLNAYFIWNYIGYLGLRPALGRGLSYCHPGLYEVSEQPVEGWIRVDAQTVELLRLCSLESGADLVGKDLSATDTRGLWKFLRLCMLSITGKMLNTLASVGNLIG